MIVCAGSPISDLANLAGFQGIERCEKILRNLLTSPIILTPHFSDGIFAAIRA